jgi:hypothetical protein
VLDRLPQVTTWSQPTLAFAHIVSPHPPFVFGENGEDVGDHYKPFYLSDGEYFREWYGDRKAYIDGYRKQAKFLTGQVERMIGRILASCAKPPVIILQSDHGSGLGLATESAAETDMIERMSILNCYYMPDAKGKSPLYQNITPVNSLRIVLNTYFDARMDLLPDRNYFSTWGEPFRFIDVTETVQLAGDDVAGNNCAEQPAPVR